jgi:hypothetical protein
MKIKKIAGAAAVVPAAVLLASLNSSPPPAVPVGNVVVTSSSISTLDDVGDEKTTGPCPTTLDACPPEGCGGDPALNSLKNRLDAPTDDDAEPWSLARIVKLNKRSPTGWSKKNTRDILEDLGEGTPVSVKGWLVNAHVSTLETCNCKVSGTDNKDFHLNLTSTKPDAKKDPEEAKDEAMDRSVVVEMSPRSRRKDWVLTRLKALADVPTYVRVTGWLMFDSAHASFEHMPRASAWEVHPVTKFEVCVETKTKCDKGSGWKPLEEAQ